MKAAGHNTEWVDGVGTNIVNQGNVGILRGNIETWKNEIASEEQKLEEANK